MELFINEALVRVTPQENDTIQDLLNAVSKELESDLIIAVLIVDSVYSSLDDPVVLSKFIKDIKKIELIVATRKEIGLSLLEDGKQFLLIGSQELKSGNLAKKHELISSFAWILESLEALRGSLAFPPTDIPILKAILTQTVKALDNGISVDQAKLLGEEISQVIDLFDVLKLKLINEDSFSKENVINQMQNILPVLPEIASSFQVGQDLRAIQELCKIIDIIEMFARLAAKFNTDNVLALQAEKIKDISLQLLQAFENKDFILIADLIEYDLTECIEEILENND